MKDQKSSRVGENLKIFKSLNSIYIPTDEPVEARYLDESFLSSIRPIACFVQFLGLMPVCGVGSENPQKIEFKWMSVRAFVTVLYILYGVFISGLYLHFIHRIGITSINFVGLIFFSYTTTCTLIFLSIATKWPRLMRQWSRVEARFLTSPYRQCGWKLSRKVKLIAIVVIKLAFFEHLLYLVNSAYNQYQHAVTHEIRVEEPLSHFLRNQIGFVYAYVPFSLPVALANELMNMSMTFGWNYMELFVMMISLGLATRFQQVNARLGAFRGKIVPEHHWARVRADYSALCDLVDTVDYDLRFLILLSNLNNLYFVCYQLLHVFEKLPYALNTVYFWFSLVYLASRTLVAQLLAASIHESSKYPIEIMASVPPEGWCVEMQRFMDQARSQPPALSGMKFFFLTRKSILSMISTIVTYELVLMQLHDNE